MLYKSCGREHRVRDMKTRTFFLAAIVAAVAYGQSIGARAAAVDVSYTASGSPSNWVLDFSVTNSLGGTNDIYFFGVSLPTGHNIVGSPTGYIANTWLEWSMHR